jgi:deoxyribonuclease IV
MARGMLFVGPAGYPEGSKGPVQAVEKVHKLGLNALEVQFGRGVNINELKAVEMGARAEELGVALSAHAPYYINFNSPPDSVKKSRDWLLSSLRAADLFKGRIVVVHAASYMGRTSEETTQAVIDGLIEASDLRRSEGLTPVIGLETMGKTGSWGTLKEIERVVKAVPGVEPVPDFGHIHARGQGCLRTAEDFQKVLDEYLAIHPGRAHCHFSCIEYTAKGEKRHLLLEKRDPDFELLCPSLTGCGRDVTIISETPAPADDAITMLRLLRDR